MCIVMKFAHAILDIFDVLQSKGVRRVNEGFLCCLSIFKWQVLVEKMVWSHWGGVLIFSEHHVDVVWHADVTCLLVF